MRVNINKRETEPDERMGFKRSRQSFNINKYETRSKNISPPRDNKKKYSQKARVNPIFSHSEPKLKKQQQQNETAVGNS